LGAWLENYADRAEKMADKIIRIITHAGPQIDFFLLDRMNTINLELEDYLKMNAPTRVVSSAVGVDYCVRIVDNFLRFPVFLGQVKNCA